MLLSTPANCPYLCTFRFRARPTGSGGRGPASRAFTIVTFGLFSRNQIMDDRWESEVIEYGAINITGFRIVDATRPYVKDFLAGWHRLDPATSQGAGRESISVRIYITPRSAFLSFRWNIPSSLSLFLSLLWEENLSFLFFFLDVYIYICFDFPFKFLTMRRRLRWWVYGLIYFCLYVGFLSYFLKYSFSSDMRYCMISIIVSSHRESIDNRWNCILIY